MSEVGLYVLKLSFTPPDGVTGAGRMTLALTVNAVTGELHGQAEGIILEGTQHPRNRSFRDAVDRLINHRSHRLVCELLFPQPRRQFVNIFHRMMTDSLQHIG